MKIFEFTSGPFADTATHDAEVKRIQPRYYDVITWLGKLGSSVAVSRISETIQPNLADQPAFHLIDIAEHDFIFPPQTDLVRETSNIVPLDENIGFEMISEVVRYSYDPTPVRGALRIYYADASDQIVFRATDLRDSSKLPDEVMTIIHRSFEVTATGKS